MDEYDYDDLYDDDSGSFFDDDDDDDFDDELHVRMFSEALESDYENGDQGFLFLD